MRLRGTFPGEPTFLPLMGAGYENCPHYDDLSEVFNAINIFFLKYALTLVSVSSHITGCSSTSLSFSLLSPLLVLHKTDFSRTFISSCQAVFFPLYTLSQGDLIYTYGFKYIYVLMILKFVSLVQVFSMSSRL